MKRLFSYGALSFILSVLLVAFAACGTGQTEYDQQAPEYVLAVVNLDEYVPAAAEVRMLNTAANDMRDTRLAATSLAAFANGAAGTPLERVATATHNPLDLGNVPTRSQFTLLLNSITHNGQDIQEVNFLRPGFDVTVYNNPTNAFYYIEGGLSLMGMPFPLVNIGIDGGVVSAKVPLLYDRYFAVDVNAVLDDLQAEFGDLMDLGGFGDFVELMEAQAAAIETFENALDFEALLLDLVIDLLETATVEPDNGQYNVTIPAEDANAALSALWDMIFEAYAMLDVSAFNGEFEEYWLDFLTEGREAVDFIIFTQDVHVYYKLDGDVLTNVTFLGVLGEYGFDDEIQLLISYANISGDHIGEVAWVFEMKNLDEVWPATIRVEYYTVLNTNNGYFNRGNLTLYLVDRWDEIELELGWYLDRTPDNRFSAGLVLGAEDFEINFFAQGEMSYGDDYFNFDLDRLGFEASDDSFSFDIELSAFFSCQAIQATALPVIDAADQFFVMDATSEELDLVMQQIEDNIAGLSSLLDMFGFGS